MVREILIIKLHTCTRKVKICVGIMESDCTQLKWEKMHKIFIAVCFKVENV